MLAANDQENLVYSHQTNASSKPLNQGIRGPQSKTPGQRAPKTPFRTWINDENNPTAFEARMKTLKTLGKGDEHGIHSIRKEGKLDSTAVVTPMYPPTRAPLGMKTANTKARAIRTPAPPNQPFNPLKTLKKASTARKSIKSKIVIASSEPVDADVLSRDSDTDVPDVEYCPPHPVELPDPPEDITYDDTFPYLRGHNICAGYGDVYDIPRDEHGISLGERKDEQAHARILQQMEDKFKEEMAKPWPMEDEDGDVVTPIIATGHKERLKHSSNIDTIKARGAASALSSQPPTRLPSAATKGTASSMQKKKPSLSYGATKKSNPQPTNPSSMRHHAAIATSKTTIGYSKGRNVSATLPEKTMVGWQVDSGKIDHSEIDPVEFKKLYGEPPVGSKMWDKFRYHGLFDDEVVDCEDDLTWQLWTTKIHCEDEEEVFQLPMPEEI